MHERRRSLLAAAFLLSAPQAHAVTVCRDATCDEQSVAAALTTTNTTADDTIEIWAPGDYVEPAMIASSDVTIQAMADGVRILGSAPGDLLSVNSGAEVTLTGFELAGDFARRLLHVTGGADVTAQGVTFRSGEAPQGGAIRVAGGATTLNLDVCQVLDSKASDLGGGLFVTANALVTISGTTFDGNLGAHGGGAIAVSDADLVMTGGFLRNGTAGSTDGCPPGFDPYGFGGGGLYADAADVTLSTVKLEDNCTIWDGGDIYADTSAVTLANSTAARGVARRTGGSIAARGAGGALSVLGGSLSDASAVGSGGLISADRVTLGLSGVTLSGGDTPELGGAVYATSLPSLTLTSVLVDDNEASSGGGLYVQGAGVVTVDGSTFSGNRAVPPGVAGFFEGGALLISDTLGGTTQITRSTLSNNQANQVGGALSYAGQLAASTLTIADTSFVRNTAGGEGGGARILDAHNITLLDNRLIANTAVGTGGGLFAAGASTTTARRNLVCANVGASGGGAATSDGDQYWTNNVFVENDASSNSGGLFVGPGSATWIANNDFVGNSAASGAGGGAGIDPGGTPEVRFLNNIVSDTVSGDGLAPTTVGTTVVNYNAWYQNAARHSSLELTTPPHIPNYVDVPPLFTTWTNDGQCTTYDFRPLNPALTDTGDPDPTLNDPDGSRSDVGATGGPFARGGGVDSDGDGVPVPLDCDDGNPLYADPLAQWFDDADGDGFGGEPGTLGCAPPVWYVAPTSLGGDCHDNNANVHPGALEICDGLDDDCDGLRPAAEADDDGDGYVECSVDPSGWAAAFSTVIGGDDCDDDDSTVHPGAPELCDGQLNACSSLLPESESDPDGDGYVSCDLDPGGWDGPGTVVAGVDCAPFDPTVNPGAAEIPCNGIDDDCVGGDLVGGDGDGDGVTVCAGDCDDTDPAVYPYAVEIPASGVDEDCDGWELCFVDADGDGFGSGVTVTVDVLDCDGAARSWTGDDCDDQDDSVYPGADERCDLVDSDCDGDLNDPDAEGLVAWYEDADGDGFGDGTAVEACVPTETQVQEAGDCDDTHAAVYPGADEVLDDGLDNDCDSVQGATWLGGSRSCGCTTGAAPGGLTGGLLALLLISRRSAAPR